MTGGVVGCKSQAESALVKARINKVAREIFDEVYEKTLVSTNVRQIQNWMAIGIIPKGDVLRVEINEDGTVNILDFSLVTTGGRENFRMPQEEVAPWIMETVSMLRIAPEGDLVPELGFKVSDLLYYIIDRTGESK